MDLGDLGPDRAPAPSQALVEDDDQIRFRHALTRDTVYGELLSVERSLAEPILLVEDIESLTAILAVTLGSELERRGEGRIFYYDATGGRWEEDDFQATGSGSCP